MTFDSEADFTTCRHLSSIDLDPGRPSRLLRRSTPRCGSHGPGVTSSRSATLPTSCPRSGPRSTPCRVRPQSLAAPTTLFRLCCRPPSLRLAASRSPTRMRSPRPPAGSPPSRAPSRPPRSALKNQLCFWVSAALMIRGPFAPWCWHWRATGGFPLQHHALVFTCMPARREISVRSPARLALSSRNARDRPGIHSAVAEHAEQLFCQCSAAPATAVQHCTVVAPLQAVPPLYRCSARGRNPCPGAKVGC